MFLTRNHNHEQSVSNLKTERPYIIVNMDHGQKNTVIEHHSGVLMASYKLSLKIVRMCSNVVEFIVNRVFYRNHKVLLEYSGVKQVTIVDFIKWT